MLSLLVEPVVILDQDQAVLFSNDSACKLYRRSGQFEVSARSKIFRVSGHEDADPKSLVDLLASEDLHTKMISLAEEQSEQVPSKFSI